MSDSFMKNKICLIGASGLVGRTFLNVLEKSDYPFEPELYASEKSEGKIINFKDRQLKIKKLCENFNTDCDFTVFMTDSRISLKYAKLALLQNSVVIDNSSAFRQNKEVPLIVPPVNGYLSKDKKLISNPNCVAAICSIPLFLLDRNYGISRINFTTFQSVSGSGKKGLDELENVLKGEKNTFYKSDISKTCIPEIGDTNDNFYCEEECKIAYEMPKILNNYEMRISASCVRVPINYGHLASISVTLKKEFLLSDIEEIFSSFKGLCYIPHNEKISYPEQSFAYGKSDVFVGRLRRDTSLDNTLLFFVAGDNLLRGAAYNAYEILLSWLKYNKC